MNMNKTSESLVKAKERIMGLMRRMKRCSNTLARSQVREFRRDAKNEYGIVNSMLHENTEAHIDRCIESIEADISRITREGLQAVNTANDVAISRSNQRTHLLLIRNAYAQIRNEVTRVMEQLTREEPSERAKMLDMAIKRILDVDMEQLQEVERIKTLKKAKECLNADPKYLAVEWPKGSNSDLEDLDDDLVELDEDEERADEQQYDELDEDGNAIPRPGSEAFKKSKETTAAAAEEEESQRKSNLPQEGKLTPKSVTQIEAFKKTKETRSTSAKFQRNSSIPPQDEKLAPNSVAKIEAFAIANDNLIVDEYGGNWEYLNATRDEIVQKVVRWIEEAIGTPEFEKRTNPPIKVLEKLMEHRKNYIETLKAKTQ
jgi:hypothetical protein